MARLKESVLKSNGNHSKHESSHYDSLTKAELLRLLEKRDADEAGGLRLHYQGQTPPWLIVRQVRPRRQKIESKLSIGSEETQASNLIIEGENLQAMVSLYKYRGQIDLILTDPPYNTGQDFRYNDKWDSDPNDPDLGKIVPEDDGSRHSKWLRFMTPRLWMMREMLKPGGVIAVCIDHRELYRLGMLMDAIFQEENRIGVINWQKSYSPRSDNKGLSTATEYVLVYAKSADQSKTGLIERTAAMDARYGSPDGDPFEWKSGDASGPNASTHLKMVYGIQSPFNGKIYYPPESRCWGNEKKSMRGWLEAWGPKYEETWIDDGNVITAKGKKLQIKALVLRGAKFKQGKMAGGEKILNAARRVAESRLKKGTWPPLYFGLKGETGPQLKRYLKDVKKGKVPMTYWADEDYEVPLRIESQSWDHAESGHSQAGVNELDTIVGKGHDFKTIKPLRLFKKIIQIWCPPKGIVLDPFSGSGTTAHAVLGLNKEGSTDRKFILVEQGRPDRGDPYARSLTYTRVRRAITGERPASNGKLKVSATPLPGGFRFTQLTKTVDADAVLALEREEMLDLLLTSHWDQGERSSSYLKRFPAGTHSLLFAVNNRGNGYFLIWNGPGKPAILDRAMFRTIAEEARAAKLSPPYHVYARLCTYSGPNTEFYQIPDRILDKLGFNEATQPFRID